MIELAHHLLDIGENSLQAGAKTLLIEVKEERKEGFLILEITDDGRGMTQEEQVKALDPFYTTKKVRKVGLGLPMLFQAAERTGGRLELKSTPGKGTKVTVHMGLHHIDRQPLGDVGGAIAALILGNPEVRIIYRHNNGAETFEMDTEQIKKELDGLPLNHPEVLNFIRDFINTQVREMSPEA
jgi:hypothetical protein